jgi:hypothetical protein
MLSCAGVSKSLLVPGSSTALLPDESPLTLITWLSIDSDSVTVLLHSVDHTQHYNRLLSGDAVAASMLLGQWVRPSQ